MTIGNETAYLAGGGKLSAPDNATPRYRSEVMRQMAVLIDSLMAGAAGFADCINLAPGLKERITAARIVLEKFGHAEKILGLMDQFGANTAQYVSAHPWAARRDRSLYLGTRRIEGDMRLNVFHYPIYGWVDAVILNVLMGRATGIQLDELTRCSYAPLADTIAEILPQERRHAELGEEGLRVALSRGHDRTDAQASVNYWYPRVADTFGRADSERFEIYRKYGLRQRPNQQLLERWQAVVGPILASFDLQIPERLPEQRGPGAREAG
ncbi:MAG: phenylacetate-CoA oxygenase subunit PaaI [Acetobacteraceae bacterium]|nr:phenylacetate-CoA oxygenase subunit PaaI [Acetobacteraceae bacterium]